MRHRPQTCPHPSPAYDEIRVFYPRGLTNLIFKGGHDQIAYKYRPFKMTKAADCESREKVVMLVRPSMLPDLRVLDKCGDALSGATLIYSMWEGYLEDDKIEAVARFCQRQGYYCSPPPHQRPR